MRTPFQSLASFVLYFLAFTYQTGAAEVNSVTQYGITWTFDKPHPVGQFVTGDWWVIGPVKVIRVSPTPGRAPADEPVTAAESRYGAASLGDDKTLRNGSMVIAGPINGSYSKQGYDSRALNFDASLSVHFPYDLLAGQSLISTISSETYKAGKLATPYLPGTLFPDGLAGPEMAMPLESGAILTALDKEPPADAFRPPYAGTNKPIYTIRDIQWNLLPKLAPVPSTPAWEKMARIYQRPWIDHINDWIGSVMGPAQNQAAYGGVIARINAYASLMLLQDVAKEKKMPLMIGFLQYGIDLHGLTASRRQWTSDGGHWMGRKWPILFASLMLGKPEIREFPRIATGSPVLYEKIKLSADPSDSVTTTLFSEDMDTYYGKGARGENVLWQVTYHTRAREPYLEKPYSEWTKDDKFANTYLWIGGNWPAFALSALYLKGQSTWNHDAFFDFCDWWMAPGSQKIYSNDGHVGPTRNNSDKFVQEMWAAYRAGAPAQPGGISNLKWVWTDGKMNGDYYSAKSGHWIPNPKGK